MCNRKIVGKLPDIDLSNGYAITDLVIEEFDRGDYTDKAIRGNLKTPDNMRTPEGDPLCVLYDVDMRFRDTHNELDYIGLHWLLPKGIWKMVEDALTEAISK